MYMYVPIGIEHMVNGFFWIGSFLSNLALNNNMYYLTPLYDILGPKSGLSNV